MIFVMHRRGIRRNDLTALRLAKRWSKVSAVLFAIGAAAVNGGGRWMGRWTVPVAAGRSAHDQRRRRGPKTTLAGLVVVNRGGPS